MLMYAPQKIYKKINANHTRKPHTAAVYMDPYTYSSSHTEKINILLSDDVIT